MDSIVNVFSAGNRFFENGAGTIVIGGLSSNNTPANGNTVNFEAHGDQFTDNNLFVPFDAGGLIVLGGENISLPDLVNDNTVNVELFGCRMADNTGYDLAATGARLATPGSPGLNNHVTIEIHGGGSAKGKWNPVEFTANSVPFDPNTTNSVTILR